MNPPLYGSTIPPLPFIARYQIWDISPLLFYPQVWIAMQAVLFTLVVAKNLKLQGIAGTCQFAANVKSRNI